MSSSEDWKEMGLAFDPKNPPEKRSGHAQEILPGPEEWKKHLTRPGDGFGKSLYEQHAEPIARERSRADEAERETEKAKSENVQLKVALMRLWRVATSAGVTLEQLDAPLLAGLAMDVTPALTREIADLQAKRAAASDTDSSAYLEFLAFDPTKPRSGGIIEE